MFIFTSDSRLGLMFQHKAVGFFRLNNSGELYLVPGARYGEHSLEMSITDGTTTAASTATVRIFYLDDDALSSVASLRVAGQ